MAQQTEDIIDKAVEQGYLPKSYTHYKGKEGTFEYKEGTPDTLADREVDMFGNTVGMKDYWNYGWGSAKNVERRAKVAEYLEEVALGIK